MISPEVLRRYPFFNFLNDVQLKSIAMLADEVSFATGETVLESGQPAERLYLLMEGGLDLYYVVEGEAGARKEFSVGEVNPGEAFGLSACIEPYILTTTVRSPRPARAIKIEAADLRLLLEKDCTLGYLFMTRIAKATMERLQITRTQLAAAWA